MKLNYVLFTPLVNFWDFWHWRVLIIDKEQNLFIQSFCLTEVSWKFMQERTTIFIFSYILYFHFVLINDQPD